MEYFDLFVVGAGGTGSYFLKEVSRFIMGNERVRQHINEMVICDGDIVEEKNLARQNFQKEDIGRNKANVMADVLNDVFQTQWRSIPNYLTSVDTLKEVLNNDAEVYPDKRCGANAIPVIVGCVDNHAARLLCESFFESATSCIYLDSANEFEDGEAVFAYKLNGKVIAPCRSSYFPDIKKGDLRNVTEMSCEELNSVSPQHIFTNMAASLQLLTEFSNLFDNNPSPGVVFFNPHKHYAEMMRKEAKEG